MTPKGGGWAVHERGSEAAKASKRKGKGTGAPDEWEGRTLQRHPRLHRRPYDSEEDRTAALADFLNYSS